MVRICQAKHVFKAGQHLYAALIQFANITPNHQGYAAKHWDFCTINVGFQLKFPPPLTAFGHQDGSPYPPEVIVCCTPYQGLARTSTLGFMMEVNM